MCQVDGNRKEKVRKVEKAPSPHSKTSFRFVPGVAMEGGELVSVVKTRTHTHTHTLPGLVVWWCGNRAKDNPTRKLINCRVDPSRRRFRGGGGVGW